MQAKRHALTSCRRNVRFVMPEERRSCLTFELRIFGGCHSSQGADTAARWLVAMEKGGAIHKTKSRVRGRGDEHGSRESARGNSKPAMQSPNAHAHAHAHAHTRTHVCTKMSTNRVGLLPLALNHVKLKHVLGCRRAPDDMRYKGCAGQRGRVGWWLVGRWLVADGQWSLVLNAMIEKAKNISKAMLARATPLTLASGFGETC